MAIRAERDAIDSKRMPGECVCGRARIGIPEPDGIVPTPTSEGAAIGAERDAFDIMRMPRECPLVCARYRIPEPDFPITPTSEGAAIGAERDASDPNRMPPECPLVHTRYRIPKTDGSVVTPTGERPPIRAERDVSDHRRMPGEQGDLLIGHRIVEPNTNATCYREPSAIWRILYLVDHAFTEARFDAIGQVPLWGILGEGVE